MGGKNVRVANLLSKNLLGSGDRTKTTFLRPKSFFYFSIFFKEIRKKRFNILFFYFAKTLTNRHEFFFLPDQGLSGVRVAPERCDPSGCC